MSERRRRARVDKEWDMSLFVPSQRHRDDGAAAFDMTAAGFSIKTRLAMEPGRGVVFSVQVPGGKKISGAADIVWSHPLRGRWVAGARIVRISRRDSLRLRLAIDPNGRDYLRAAQNTFAGLACGAAVLAIESHMRGEGALPRGLAGLYPYIGAAGAAVSVALFLYFRLADRTG